MMEYKGYLGVVEYDAEAKLFHGDVINTRDVITFQGTTVAGIERAFKESIEDYLAWCKEEGAEPEKPYSGRFNLRLPPELHKEVTIKAGKLNISMKNPAAEQRGIFGREEKVLRTFLILPGLPRHPWRRNSTAPRLPRVSGFLGIRPPFE